MLICILGRQPALGLAELEASFGAGAIKPFGSNYCLLNQKALPEFAQFGGVIKAAEIITTLPSSQWNTVANRALSPIVAYLKPFAGHKLTLGLSAYELRTSSRQVSNLVFSLKKKLREQNMSIRAVTATTTSLNSAQVLHNKLSGGNGFEFLLIGDGHTTHLARTVFIQDIESYSKRDFSRPKRDARVGMLPPKLAQIMLNLAQTKPDNLMLDPFCGTGVVLMEAALRNNQLMGSDINPTMIDYTKANLDWLAQAYHVNPQLRYLACADATSYHWPTSPDHVVSETYLGRPLVSLPESAVLQTIIRDCNTILTKFLANLRPQLAASARSCIAVPCWATGRGFIHLPVVDDLKNMGYNRVRFLHVSNDNLIYHRTDQIVARELLVLITK